MLNIQLTHVPYQGGAASLKDVLGGQIPLLITTEQLLVPHEEQGRLKTLFVTSRERNPRMPQVPTAKEVGLPEVERSEEHTSELQSLMRIPYTDLCLQQKTPVTHQQ